MTSNSSNFSPINDWSDDTSSTASRLFDYTVIANDGEKVGKVENVWMNDNDRHGFIAISTGWIFGRQCLIPMESIQVDHTSETIRIPFSKEMVKNSPNVAEDYNVTSEEGQQVRDYYNVSGTAGMQAGTNTSIEPGTFNRTGIDARVNDNIIDDRNVVDNTPIDRRTGDPGGFNIAAAGASASMQDDTEHIERHHTSDVRHDDKEIHLAEEEVNIGKREVSAGRVRLRKVVRTEVVNQPVELRREDVIIERVDDAGHPIDGEHFTEDEVEIELKREEAVVDKTVHPAGTVRARKVTDTKQENIQETVRKEDVEVVRDVDETAVTAKKKRGKNPQ
jgi:stress response protein YsnF